MRTLPMKQAFLAAAALGFLALALPVVAQTDSHQDPPPAPPAPTVSADALPPKRVSWPFNGPFGTYDRAALQRGFQVYKEVCSACHPVKHLYFRDLAELGYSEDQVKGIAAQVQGTDGPNDQRAM